MLRKCILLHMLSTFEHQLQSLNVGLWPKIEGFCHLHSKLMVIFLKHLLFKLSHNSVLRKLSIWAMYFQVLVYEQCTGYSYSLYMHSPVMCLINIQ